MVVEAGPRKPLVITCYAVMYMGLMDIARKHGYALALHGSMQQDLDLVAVPWADDAADPEAIRDAVGGFIPNMSTADPYDETQHNPAGRPLRHGQRATMPVRMSVQPNWT